MYWFMVFLMMVCIIVICTPQHFDVPENHVVEIYKPRAKVYKPRAKSDYWIALGLASPLLIFVLGWLYEIVVAYIHAL